MLLKVFNGPSFKDCEEAFNFWMGKDSSKTIHTVGFHNKDGKPAEITVLYAYKDKVEQPRILPITVGPGRTKL